MNAPSGALETQRSQFTISTDPRRIDVDLVHAFLWNAEWCEGIERERVERAIAHSLPFGVYLREKQVGFARVVTDFATFAWLADVFIVDSYRGHGLGRWLVETIVAHPDLVPVRRFLLATRDAGWLYAQFGFEELRDAWRYMSKIDNTPYGQGG